MTQRIGETVYLGASDMVGVDRLGRVIGALADALADLSAGRACTPPRTVIEHRCGRQLVVGPAVWPARGVGSTKISTLTPDNAGRGLPLIHGVVVLTDLVTGQLTALLDGGALTALRTGAVAALATRLCAPEDAGDLAVIGAGVQARALVRAMFAVRPIRSVRVFSRDRGRAGRFADWVRDGADRPVRATACDTVQAAVAGAAIICTATSTAGRAPLVAADWVAEGAHVNVIGGTHEEAIEIDPALLATAFVLVEQRAAALAEAGEVRAALAGGVIGPDDLHELGSLVGQRFPAGGRTSVFRGVGLAIEDTAAAAALYETVRPAGGSGAGTTARTR